MRIGVGAGVGVGTGVGVGVGTGVAVGAGAGAGIGVDVGAVIPQLPAWLLQVNQSVLTGIDHTIPAFTLIDSTNWLYNMCADAINGETVYFNIYRTVYSHARICTIGNHLAVKAVVKGIIE